MSNRRPHFTQSIALYFFNIHFNIIFLPVSRYLTWSSLFRFSGKNFVCIYKIFPCALHSRPILCLFLVCVSCIYRDLFYVTTVASHTPSSRVIYKTWRTIRWFVRRNVYLQNERRFSITFFEYGEQNQVMYIELQDEQCAYNLTLMGVQVNLFFVEK
jgi:hypothetical protein